MLKNKNILLISPEPWDHIFVSKHHYARHLAQRGNVVFFLNPPSEKDEINKTDFEGVFSVSYSGFPRGLRFYPILLQQYFIRRRFNILQHLCKVMLDIVWSFDNSVFFDFSALPKGVLKISHIVDLNQDFQTERAASTADYCFCTTEMIKERLLKYNSKVFKINHGFNIPGNDSSSVTLPGKSKVNALYAGNLAIPFIDWVFLYNVVSGNPEVDFIFAGPNAELFTKDSDQNQAKKNVQFCDNAFFVGRLKSDELIRYQVSADILLVTYQEKYHLDQANPHKMMEYLGSGKMIVATKTIEFNHLAAQKYFLMSEQNSNFSNLLKKAVTELEYWNSDEKVFQRKLYALDNTYERQIQKIENIISSK